MIINPQRIRLAPKAAAANTFTAEDVLICMKINMLTNKPERRIKQYIDMYSIKSKRLRYLYMEPAYNRLDAVFKIAPSENSMPVRIKRAFVLADLFLSFAVNARRKIRNPPALIRNVSNPPTALIKFSI